MIRELKRAPELGYRGHALYRFSVCDTCGKERWVRLLDFENGKGKICRSCGYPSSNMHQKKLDKLIASGAKRASELGKPVFSKRDPWYYPHNCSNCEKPIYHQKKDLHRTCKACQYRNAASGKDHPNWKGGRYRHNSGYILVLLREDNTYFPMANPQGYVFEHRLVVANSIGRCLLDKEIVHHINGVKDDNDVKNLELLPNLASHLPYIFLQEQINILQEQVTDLHKQVKLLQWHNKELKGSNITKTEM